MTKASLPLASLPLDWPKKDEMVTLPDDCDWYRIDFDSYGIHLTIYFMLKNYTI